MKNAACAVLNLTLLRRLDVLLTVPGHGELHQREFGFEPVPECDRRGSPSLLARGLLEPEHPTTLTFLSTCNPPRFRTDFPGRSATLCSIPNWGRIAIGAL